MPMAAPHLEAPTVRLACKRPGEAVTAPIAKPVAGRRAADESESVGALWERYRESAGPIARELLLAQHLSLVYFVARRMSARAPGVEYGELVSAGTLGLLAALKAFDASRGFAFSTYAVQRIQGAILDDLRSRDCMPRSRRVRVRRMHAARAELEARLQRAPKPAEVARELGLDLPAYYRWCDELEQGVVVSAGGAAHPDATGQALPEPPGPEDQGPDRQLIQEERRAQVRTALGALPERERTVLALSYYEELSLKQVAAVLGVTESRVCQIRQRALERLKGTLSPHIAA
jgi:RNA polymerase sigma factor FliA